MEDIFINKSQGIACNLGLKGFSCNFEKINKLYMVVVVQP